MYVASVSGGATRNGKRIVATQGAALEGARLAGPQHYLERIAKTAPGMVPVPKIHSLALRLARVASGDIDAAFASVNARDWDLAAADLLVHEAGGVLTTFAGQTLVYNKPEPFHPPLVAAGPKRHAELTALVQERSISR
jgi:myo-inositol-1(or 4)-monophosphatase